MTDDRDDPMFNLTTTDGRTMCSYIQEADVRNGLLVLDDDDNLVWIDWPLIDSLVRADMGDVNHAAG